MRGNHQVQEWTLANKTVTQNVVHVENMALTAQLGAVYAEE